MVIFLIVNNILVIFGRKFSLSYSEDDRDGKGWLFFSDFLFFCLYLFWVKKFEKTKKMFCKVKVPSLV